MKLYQQLARAIGARNRCDLKPELADWSRRWREQIDAIVDEFPSGSGFDSGTKLSDDSTPERLIFTTAFHHMNENGYYDGWTEHSVIVTPSLEMEFNTRITGRDRHDIKDYIGELFCETLGRPELAFEPAKTA